MEDPTPEESRYHSMLGNSVRMRVVKNMIDRIAPTDATVLVWGESGVGKELVARALHHQSPRRDRPFIKVNCAALPLELLESELFGYERGAFTGATRHKPGKFELAHTGTIFLDEIGEMALPLQAKLLQVLQDWEFSRLGSKQDIRVDVRVIAATNKNLVKLVERGGFREDLYYRLNVMSIYVPPLRERREEIPILTDRFLAEFAEQYGRPLRQISAETLGRFMDYHWPGNVRELENIVKRIVVLENEDFVARELLVRGQQPEYVTLTDALEPAPPAPEPKPASGVWEEGLGLREIARRAADEAEGIALQEVLERVHWHRLEAARRLRVSYKTLLTKMKRHGLH
jgi:transcriptional regulator with PAS, ATPase and Fis domain